MDKWDKKTIHFIGVGRVGSFLMGWLGNKLPRTVFGLCNSTYLSTKKVQNKLGIGRAYKSIFDMPLADVWFLTVPDDSLASVVNQLTQNNKIDDKTIVLHASGAKSSDILAPIKEKGGKIGSLHPVGSFLTVTKKSEIHSNFSFVYEGDPCVLPLVKELFRGIKGKMLSISKKNKALYHAGCVFLSNYLVTMASMGINILESAGIGQQESALLAHQLMSTTLSNINKEKDLSQALTGPIARGDISTIQGHLEHLKGEERNLYKILGKLTLDSFITEEGKKTLLEEILL